MPSMTLRLRTPGSGKTFQATSSNASRPLPNNLPNTCTPRPKRSISSKPLEPKKPLMSLGRAEPPNIQETQQDFTGANQAICKLIQSLPQLIQTASRAINLHDEVANALKSA
ncbi:uncharacterized protein PGTG_20438 [Puccinia graminis f. sp. tritici CRL 75-36-700-3]|uniref:Uncharacterized protein n=1 Tax=Puccinia graminis f. sp. tritici (strain CRL 75-36-700-3 / race SCCL) TaxID=418459 RepID=E3NY33_PUCGT|nr:uncharacterized protein PGTG_20438 [Puccinia graminis f. sp. tritici CRL 75-36-700-3]EFP94482.1 hypothetical protein PGTG_20438 [Puccinia graminis f. sp. tritici CRL 75-36-700-3]